MFVIKTVNETTYRRQDVYLYEKNVYDGLNYCCDEEKNALICPDMVSEDIAYCGCSQAFSHGSISEQLNTILSMILYANRVYRNEQKALLKHRIVSFEENDLLSVEELSFIAQQLVDWYALMGFPGFYGIHLNTENPHIHLQIGTVNYFNGNRLHIDFEKTMLTKIIGYWYKRFYEALLQNPPALEARLLSKASAYNLSPANAAIILQTDLLWINKRLDAFANLPNAYPAGCVYSF